MRDWHVISWGWIFIAGWLFLGCGGGYSPESQQKFNQAKQAYLEGMSQKKTPTLASQNFLKSAILYEEIIESRVQNGWVHYNAGNAYFLAGDIGRALLHFRQAEFFMPSDRQLQRNIEITLKRRGEIELVSEDEEDEAENTSVWESLFFWHFQFSTTAKLYLSVILLFSLVLVLTLRIFITASWYRVSALIFVIFFSLPAVGLTSSVVVDFFQDDRQIGVVIVEDTFAKRGAGESFDNVYKQPLPPGTEFDVVNISNDWVEAIMPDQTRVWFASKKVATAQLSYFN